MDITAIVGIVFGTMVGGLSICCGTYVVIRFINSRVEIARARALGGPESLAVQVQALRQEVCQLREQNADLILGFDTALSRLGQLQAGAAAQPEGLAGSGQRAISHPEGIEQRSAVSVP